MRTVPLSSVAEIERDAIAPASIRDGTRYLGLEHIEPGGRILSSAPVDAGELASTKFRFSEEHVLYGKLRPYLAKIALPEFDGVCSTDIVPIRPGPELDKRFLAYFLRQPAMVEFAASRSTGANLPRLSPKALGEFQLPLPPLPEQRRISAILDQADALRRLRRQFLARLKDLRRSVFDEYQSHLNLPNRPLSDLCRKITDGTHQSPKWEEDGVPFIFVSNVRNQSVSLETERFVSEKTYSELTRNAPIEPGDVLYTCVGSYGHAALAPREKFLFQRHIAHLKPNLEKLVPEYLVELLECLEVKRQADRFATGIAQKTVTLATLKSLQVRVPSIEQQRKIALRLRQINKLSHHALSTIEEADALFASIQRRAFRGGL